MGLTTGVGGDDLKWTNEDAVTVVVMTTD